MHATMSIRDLARSGSKMGDYDYIDIADQKSKEYKGVFIPARFADAIKADLEKRLAAEREKKAQKILRFAGIADGEIGEADIGTLKAQKKIP